MKKISKVEPMAEVAQNEARAVGKRTAKKSGSKVRIGMQRETIGIDLGDKVSRYAILNEEGDLVEEGSFRNVASSIEKHFGGATKPARIAMEAGTQSAWIERELRRLGHEVIVADTRQLAWITASDKKNDRTDAAKLALLARADKRLLNQVQHRTAEQQAELNVIRARDALVRARTLLVNAARGSAKGFGHRLPPALTLTFGARSLASLPQMLKPALQVLLAEIDQLSQRIKDYDQQIAGLANQHEEVVRLASIPGVGAITALAFVLTLGNAARFAHSRDVGAYLGLCPKQRQSGSINPQLGISKAGNGYLRRLLVQCSQHKLGHFGKDSALRQWGLRKAQSGGKHGVKRAVTAVARKLAVVMHRMWQTGQLFQPFPVPA